MPTHPQKLTAFIRAQESLYGPITTIPDPSQWKPPAQSGGHRGRYLWTDAFGVLNFLTLHRETTNPQNNLQAQAKDHYLTLATNLITTVHRTLGTTRSSPPEPLPRATPSTPLAGGLRIGKPHAHGPDGDGQYHHYLTLWMFALNRTAVATRDRTWNDQAVALATAIHPHFVRGGSSRGSSSGRDPPHHHHQQSLKMVWKMDVNLEEVLVASEGNLDPVDGLVVFRLLRETDRWFRGEGPQPEDEGVLGDEIEDYRRIVKRKGEGFVSLDPLDLGMAMWTAHWVADTKGEEWAGRMAEDCCGRVFDLFERRHYLDRDLRARLAFREFGTCLGLQCMAAQASDKDRAVELKAYADRIVECWDPHIWMETGRNATPEELRPITRVMYAAALIPGAFCRGYFGPEPVA
ncbi:uncharacterized protein BO95DRAFT_29258 [Aspergillus brunneoviolaceus CBS 621.78]|uniref:Uncharacterized protein n=1 Tax=Aspergillus brunneoviolaceus CBS 621.78 TaxID=1450534 RepID=A0ACD1GJB3_9EURO|nr:hypothetical protein BO95DRAFT_29258 [Aspergillus brunneoviolaceus CBS 621.78]RAH49171.1 hypothetical protein BO95DRAFT_29258 [Aspergillus brunneoviolaceus CBS 621.78]